MRQIEGLRLDELFRVAFEKALSGDRDFLLGVDRCIATMTRRARLFGLDTPVRVKAEQNFYVGGDNLDAEMERFRRILRSHEARHDLENCPDCNL
jgi:hypothetical protein